VVVHTKIAEKEDGPDMHQDSRYSVAHAALWTWRDKHANQARDRVVCNVGTSEGSATHDISIVL
jgi:hypothetical protein